MARVSERRRFLELSAAGGAALGLGDLAFLAELPPVSAEQAEVNPGLVRFDAGIEPLVRLIEDTPRSDLLEVVARRIRRGVTYHEVVAALFLASVRNVQPRPSVGFKFHAVLVVNSALLASLSSPESDRWLPIFWALDEFKNSQADDQRKGGWRMKPVDESTVPAAHEARKAFVEAMESWDEKRADGAVAGLVRTGGANEIYDLFCHFGGRDFRSIGHKAIFVANSWRTLQFIGWQHAEPVLRSLAFALLNHGLKDTTPAKSDEAADRPWRRNQELATKMGPAWMGGKLDEGATRDMLAAFREGSNDDACDEAVKLIGRGVSPQSIWDALFVGAGELLVRQPGIVALHSVTATNALRYSFRSCGDDRTRKLLLLQNCAFLPMFRGAMRGRGKVRDTSIEDVQPRLGNCAQRVLGPRSHRGDLRRCERRPDERCRKGPPVPGGRRECSRLDQCRPAPDLHEGKEPPRLQVQLRGPGRLLPRQSGVARPVSGEQRIQSQRLSGSGQLSCRAHTRCDEGLINVKSGCGPVARNERWATRSARDVLDDRISVSG